MIDVPQHNFAGRSALILHRSDDAIARVVERCDRLGISAAGHRRDLPTAEAMAADMVVIDVDTGHDAALPWPAGEAPMPVIGLIGSESPGRLGWALRQNVDAFLPLSALGNLFSALVIAHATFERRQDLARERAEVAHLRAGRLDVVRAVIALAADGENEALALKQLRTMAMVGRTSLEDAARAVLAAGQTHRKGQR
ncbi:ANTAR domain-containing response regulator [Pseudoroseicyclus aestuarii]|uniref:AmiR/NasT family two-component response regulator n=1 Tax=Pseudoroseicyclus aestuarii TaxID=1795041 RepID=A0A318SVL6_9RHOB|nr:transcriptional antiterminator [Pseudoroseicyclus aestuarii]PYE85532.1 AmiR/NasT family two-component response regulator [Pseudoroseicyclus aestuarii]